MISATITWDVPENEAEAAVARLKGKAVTLTTPETGAALFTLVCADVGVSEEPGEGGRVRVTAELVERRVTPF